MAKRMLAIGVGGSGKAALTILKERLEETYGKVPDNVVLLSFDTDDLRDGDTFGGTKLNPTVSDDRREQEFRHVVSPPGMTMNTIFADIARGQMSTYMQWLEKEKLDRILSPAERDIRGGAQQRRPVGRVALFLRWNIIYNTIRAAISQVYGEPDTEQEVDAVKTEQSKRVIFIVGSVAGGTGSGFMVDVVNLVRRAVRSNVNWQSVDVSSIIVLPEAFSSYTTAMQDPTNLRPNSYAALRELDRFIRTHSAATPYMVRYGGDTESITWSINQPVDHVYLVDTASRSATGDLDLSGNPMRGVFPVVADFMMAHVDQGLGDQLATLRSNAGLHYNKNEGWQYSSFNVMTYIFPIDDVIESFSYRFLRELLARQYLPLSDRKIETQVSQEAQREAERIFAANAVGDRANPTIIQKAIATTQPVNPEVPDTSWQGLFNLIALSDSSFARDYQDLEQWMTYLTSNLIASHEGDYRSERYDEGYARLLNFGTHYMDECLGQLSDPDNEESRVGGQWDGILGRYPEAMRERFAAALDAALLETLNRRDPNSKVLAPSRLPMARALIAALKARLLRFKTVLEQRFGELNIDARVRQLSTDVRDSITHMHETQDKTFALFGKPEARKAQDAYIGYFNERMTMLLHQRVYRVVQACVDTLGASEQDSAGRLSVLDQAALELENWQATLLEVDQRLDQDAREHEKHRNEKSRVRVRRYLTSREVEDKLYALPAHSGMVAGRVLGQVRGETGMRWERTDAEELLHYKLVTVWTQQANGAEQIAKEFFAGVKGLFQVVRKSVSVADRIAAEFTSPASFVTVVNQITDPFLRYNPSLNGKPMFNERYLSFSLRQAQDPARRFLDQAVATLGDQGVNVDQSAESDVACTIVEVARGVRLEAVDQFVACSSDYRTKLYGGRETIHLFPEEQVATDYEGRIETLGEANNKQRLLAPDLVVAMGDEAKLRAFVFACAYGLLAPDTRLDDDTGERTTDLFLTFQQQGRPVLLPLSQRKIVRRNDQSFSVLAPDEQLRRLYLNALQNFVLKATEKRGVQPGLITTMVNDLNGQGVDLKDIDNPFTLAIKDVNMTIDEVARNLGPSTEEELDPRAREHRNAQRRISRLRDYRDSEVAQFKNSPSQAVRDLGTVMDLVIRQEENNLLNRASGR